MIGDGFRWPGFAADLNGAISGGPADLFEIQDAPLDVDGLITCAVLPLRDVVLFPNLLSPLFVAHQPSLLALEDARLKGETVIAIAQREPLIEDPRPADMFTVGTEVAIGRTIRMPDGSVSLIAQGRRRVEVVEYIQTEPYMRVRARPIEEAVESSKESLALMRAVQALFEKVVELNRSMPEEVQVYAINITEPGWLADLVASAISLPLHERQTLLEVFEPTKRLQQISILLGRELDVLELEDQIHNQVQSEVDRSQREHYLREQMKAIQSELGEADLWAKEIEELRQKVEHLGLPEEVEARARREIQRLTQMPPLSPEVGIIRTYLDWLTELPWATATADNMEVANAARVLEEEHFGLTKAKERILEYIAVRSLAGERQKQPVLCFVGPPGTGKTSLGKSIAKALGREFLRISLGGIRDEAEIRGHRRTYIGALPGRILQAMRRGGTVNPLFMLDEIDKLGIDFRGDPSSALLEVLDPEQNHAFSDHYLEIPYDLSKVMFITTANTLDPIPPALLDRLEVIEFRGYIEEEKLEIARRFLIKRQVEQNGLRTDELTFSTAALQTLIRSYTWEAGVRNLERQIGRVCRKIARKKAEGKAAPRRITPAALQKLLGPPEVFQHEAERQDQIGVATGLAWTENGGDILPIEALCLEGKGGLQITGQIGDVMQESGQAALSYIKSRAKELGIKADLFEKSDLHIHIPEGSIPKDGPSAGITMAVALASVLSGRKVRHNIAMSGEITLRGRVLPVGGVREKVLAAYRMKLERVILPEKNAKDLDELPRQAKSKLDIRLVSHMDEVLDLALVPKAMPSAKRGKRADAGAKPAGKNAIRKGDR